MNHYLVGGTTWGGGLCQRLIKLGERRKFWNKAKKKQETNTEWSNISSGHTWAQDMDIECISKNSEIGGWGPGLAPEIPRVW